MKPKTRPGNSPDEKTQIEFIWKYFSLKSIMKPGTVFLFGDAMHLVHQAVPGYCWGDPKNPPVLNTNSGRYRLNIIGAYNPDTFSLIHLIDNAKYFKAKIVRAWLAKHPKLQIEFLPTYAPNLNLIERYWRLAKKVLVKNIYYEKYKTFRSAVFRFLNNNSSYIDQLKSLMVEKFQIVAA